MNTQEKIIWKFCQPSILRANDHPDFYRREPLSWGVDEAMNGKSRHLEVYTKEHPPSPRRYVGFFTHEHGDKVLIKLRCVKRCRDMDLANHSTLWSRGLERNCWSSCLRSHRDFLKLALHQWLRETSLEKSAWGQEPSPECPGQSLEQHGREAPSEESQVVGKWKGHLYGSNG
ncbi:uncharacterized protein CIMG_08705 [Coccidioides immitis RS]|uniref:Uncharacterized protein n=4 Tax=Coccidioides immitis TaxID=5501 RepID=J3K617_COCIM|nr:uncharacterized protein CIMG_08705 [Coccidioides immitis RS]EAS29959.3 hypothetical protein CIMG_08705 [Coccidioides immitis RS]KMP06945.1 hypothetical protein CIRG_06626 [Coccidioides immitis RMSCC 2394]KMU75167.1 hypothetical protein CISG_04115 [Coccidioides immitis RMSCC 3703]KMU92018.1 hypothetical protein CIHG_09790 [Coccidioides immitis H538.4]